jgi:CO/xanthine dehydrogenase FAD-binding subunit
MLPEFHSVSSSTKEEALGCLSELEDAKVLAGGTDLMVRMRRGETCRHIVDITGVPELGGIRQLDGGLRIGSTATHDQVSRNPVVIEQARSLSLASGWVGSPQIRNMGTIGGNITNASPAADTIPSLLVHDAVVTIESKGRERRERIGDFIVAPYKTSIAADEIITYIDVKGLPGYREGYERVTRRAAWAITRLSVAWAIREEGDTFGDVRLAIGSCTPMPFRPAKVEEELKGQKRSDSIIRDAVEAIIGDILEVTGKRPSFVYKLPVLRGLLERILRG